MKREQGIGAVVGRFGMEKHAIVGPLCAYATVRDNKLHPGPYRLELIVPTKTEERVVNMEIKKVPLPAL